jgi:hypothetical protein
MNSEVTITIVRYNVDDSGEVTYAGMLPRRKKFSAYYQIPLWLSPNGNLVSHGDTEEEAVEKLREMIKVFHAETSISRMHEHTISFSDCSPLELVIKHPPDIDLRCPRCDFLNPKETRFCNLCGKELTTSPSVHATKMPNVVDEAIKRISETNRLGNRVLLLTSVLVRIKEILKDENTSPIAKTAEIEQILEDAKI